MLTLPAIFIFGVIVSLANGQTCQTVGETPTDVGNYNFLSSYVQVFQWLKSPCTGTVSSITFATNPTNVERKFYVGIFEQQTGLLSSTYFKLKTYKDIIVNASSPSIITYQVPKGYLAIKKDDVFGIFYDSATTPQSEQVVPYRLLFGGSGTQFPTYVGSASLNDIKAVHNLRVGAELSSFPSDRTPALSFSILGGGGPGSCGRYAPAVDNAVITWQSWVDLSYVGDTVEYDCKPGYRLRIGSYYRVSCMEPNALVQWSELPDCMVDNRTTTTSTTTTSTTPTTPEPAPLSCSRSPGLIFNAVESVRSFSTDPFEGSTIAYSCEEGYEIYPKNAGIVTCRSDGTWSTLPICRVRRTICEPLTKPRNAYLYSQTNALGTRPATGDIHVYQCKLGYKTEMEDWRIVVNCTGGGKWSDQSPDCIPNFVPPPPVDPAGLVYSCGEPPRLSNAIELKRSYAPLTPSIPGDFVSYVCKSGNKMVGNSKAKCLGDLSWNVEFQCKPELSPPSVDRRLYCGVPLTLENARELRRHFNNPNSRIGYVGDEVVYECNTGYQIYGSPSVFCLADSAWGVRFKCIARTSD